MRSDAVDSAARSVPRNTRRHMFCVLATCSSDRGDECWIDTVWCEACCLLQHEWPARASHFDIVRSPQYVPHYAVAADVANPEYVIRATLYGVRSKNLALDDVTLNTKA